MSTATVPPPFSPTPVTYGLDASIAKFSVAKYQRMIETGILNDEEKVELLENYLVLKMPCNPPHDGTVQLMTSGLIRAIPAGWDLRVQLTVVLSDSQPEPDFAVVSGNARTYLARHPAAADVGILIEVADSSLLRDQRDKTRIYARAGIPAYWIVNLVDRRIEVYTRPTGPVPAPVYGAVQNFYPGDRLPLVLSVSVTATVAVADLLP